MNLDLGIGLSERLKKEFVQYNRAKCTNAMSVLELNVRTCQKKCPLEAMKAMKMMEDKAKAFGDITRIDNGKDFMRADGMDVSQTEFNLKQMLEKDLQQERQMEQKVNSQKISYYQQNFQNAFQSSLLSEEALRQKVVLLQSQKGGLEALIHELRNQKDQLMAKLKARDQEILDWKDKAHDYHRQLVNLQKAWDDDKAKFERQIKLYNLKMMQMDQKLIELIEKDNANQRIQGELNIFIDQLLEKLRNQENLIRDQSMEIQQIQDLNKQLQSASRPYEVKQSSGGNPLKEMMLEQELQHAKNQMEKEKENDKKNKNQLKQKDKNLNGIQKKYDDLKNELKKRNQELQKLKPDPRKEKKIKDTMSKLNNDKEKLDKELKNLKRDLEKQKFQGKELDQQNRFKDEYIKDLKGKYDDLKKKFSDLQDLKNDRDNENELLNKDLEKFKKALADAQDKLKKQEDLNIDLESENFDLNREKKKANKQNAYLEKKVKQLQEELSKMANKDNADAKEQLKDLQKQLKEIQYLNDTLDRNLRKKQFEIDNMETEMAKLRNKIKELMQQNDNLKAHLLTAQTNHNKEHQERLLVDKERKKYKQNCKELKNDIEKLQDENEELQKKNKKLQDLLKRKDDDNLNLQNRVEGLEKENQDLESDLDKEKDERRKLNTQINLLNSQIKDLNYKNNLLEEEIVDLKLEIENLKTNSVEKKKLAHLEENYAAMEVKFKRAQDDLLISTQSNEKLKLSIIELEERISELELTIKTIKIEKQGVEKKNFDMTTELKIIFNEVFNMKNKIDDVYEFLIEGDISEHEPNPINNIDSSLYTKYIIEYLQGSSSQLSEAEQEIQDLSASVENIKRKNQELLQNFQAMENKYFDIRTRHDRKTDLLGKLTVKNFILISEVERLQAKGT